jgi:adenylate cyclase
LNPNDDLIVVQQGEVLTWLGWPKRHRLDQGVRLNPYHPERYWNHLGRAYFVAHRYAEAVEAVKHIHALDHFHHALLAAAHGQMGHEADARRHVEEVLAAKPGFTAADGLSTTHYKRQEDIDHHRAALLKAGLPA